ncbi:Nuclear pore protein-like protein, partial [Colletotrichum scovillei]
MILMLEIIHGHFDRVPFSLRVRRLYDLLVLCNKYDVLSLLRPWSWHWLSAMRSTLDEPYVLWVAWEMGDVLLFRDMVVRIAEGVPISALNNPNVMGVQYGKQRMHWTPQSGQINEFLMIPLDCLQNMSVDDLSDLISLTRLMLIEAAVKPYRTILSQMKSKTHSSNQNAIKNNCVKNCIPSGVGSLVLAGMTDNFNIWDPRLPFNFTGHLKLIVDHLAGIKITIPQGCGNCLKMFSDELTNARSVMTAAIKCIAPLSKDQQAHLEKRAFQLGLRVEDVADKGAMHI